MATFKAPQRDQPKRVWRISERAPQGEWVDPAKVDEQRPLGALPEVSSGGWVVSSFDLLHGTDVIEDTQGDTIPDALLDELFAKTEKGPRNRGN
jgi:hypothetical protein